MSTRVGRGLGWGLVLLGCGDAMSGAPSTSEQGNSSSGEMSSTGTSSGGTSAGNTGTGTGPSTGGTGSEPTSAGGASAGGSTDGSEESSGSSSAGLGSSGEAASGSTGTNSSGADTGTTAAELPTIEVTAIELAQTHVLPEGQRTWMIKDGTRRLQVVGGRSLLALVALTGKVPAQPRLAVSKNGMLLGEVPLVDPTQLPPTEAGGPSYGDFYSAEVDAAWVSPGMTLQVVADGYEPAPELAPPVGVDSDFDMWTLPFYLFGANDQNTVPISVSAKPDDASMTELRAKWPIARVKFAQHPAGRIDWPYIVVEPRASGPAMRVNNKDEQKDGYAVMSAVLGVLGVLRNANGEGGTSNHYYAPLLMLTAGGKYGSPGGGLGGGSRGTGDYSYGGIFIHEQGHAFGLPHAADGYAAGNYPYVGGSLLGSAWGYDATRHEFLAPFIPPGADHYAKCKTDGGHQLDAMNRCVKQDPMQSGSGDQAPGYKYTAFSDFNAGAIQRYFEGETTLNNMQQHVYQGGVIFVDPLSSTGYSRWDSIDLKRVEVTVQTVDKGLYGFDRGLPMARDVPVYTIVFTLSRVDPLVSQIYAPIAYQGNLLRVVDPTQPAELAKIVPNVSENPWYCHASGCDYTLRVTYADQEVRHVLIRGGFRPWFKPDGTPLPSTLDPMSGDSFRMMGVNVPGGKPLQKIEVLDTPLGYLGVPANAKVLLSRP